MKKVFLTLISTFMAFCIGYAQNMDGLIAQPTHIIGKRIDASGEVTKIVESDFTYYEDGKPHTFTIPDYELSTNYRFEEDYLSKEDTWHSAGHPILEEIIQYTYEDCKVKTSEHYWSHGYNYSEYWEYSYGEDGRLARKDYLHGVPGVTDFHQHYLYEYENNGKTKTENYWTSWVDEGWKLRKKTVFQYDEEFNVVTRHIENYSVDGELTSSTLDTYTYTDGGKQETQITQTLTEDEWVNTSIMRYIYDDNGQVVERQTGLWSIENSDWDIDHKIVFETSEDGSTYTVSFYKKSEDEWVWDVFYNQTIFFGSSLANQQRTMRFYQNEDYNGHGLINQFEITLVYTEEPTYLDVAENKVSDICVYPNPGSDKLKVEAPTEDAVIRFYNLRGQLMLARPFDFSTEINAEGWPSGMYLWEIWHDSQKEACGKWVKE